MRIMHGTREIAGQGIYSVLGLRTHGYDATMVTWDRHVFGYSSDICLNFDKKKKILYPWYAIKIFGLFFYAIFRFDTFHFHFGYSLLPKNADLWALKLLHKKLVFEFHGTDLRQPSEIRKHMNYYTLNLPDEEWKTRRNAKIGKYADYIVIHDEELIPYLPKTTAELRIVPLRVDIQKFNPQYPKQVKERITIAHAPSNRAIKGTDKIISAIDKLSKVYDIDFVLVEGMTQSEALSRYEKADIIVDQLIIGTYGVFSIEAMALGKPVVTYISDEMRSTFPEELPIVNATVDNIGEVLETLIKEPELRYRLGVAGRTYVERYHDYRKIADKLYDIYSDRSAFVGGRAAFEALGK